MKLLLFILISISSLLAQNQNENQYLNIFSIGYSSPLHSLKNDYYQNTFNNYSYSFIYNHTEFHFSYRNLGTIKNSHSRISENYHFPFDTKHDFLTQAGYNFKYFGFLAGVLLFDKHHPIPVGELRFGDISNYYFSIKVLNQESIPANELNFYYNFSSALNYLSIGLSNIKSTYYLNTYYQQSLLKLYLLKIGMLSNFYKKRHIIFASFGIFYEI